MVSNPQAASLRPFWASRIANSACAGQQVFGQVAQRTFASKNDDNGKGPKKKTDEEVFEEQKR